MRAGKSNAVVCSFKLVCEEVWTALGHAGGGMEGGREAQEGGKVLELNYIVCVEETGADRQMAVDKCCRGTGRGGSQGVSV